MIASVTRLDLLASPSLPRMSEQISRAPYARSAERVGNDEDGHPASRGPRQDDLLYEPIFFNNMVLVLDH